jgi:hypothetical protein
MFLKAFPLMPYLTKSEQATSQPNDFRRLPRIRNAWFVFSSAPLFPIWATARQDQTPKLIMFVDLKIKSEVTALLRGE